MRDYLVIFEEVVSHTVYDLATAPFWVPYIWGFFFFFISVASLNFLQNKSIKEFASERFSYYLL